jgi:hypothetical protein
MDFFKPQTQQASLRFGHKKILQLPSAIAGFGDRDRIRTFFYSIHSISSTITFR